MWGPRSGPLTLKHRGGTRWEGGPGPKQMVCAAARPRGPSLCLYKSAEMPWPVGLRRLSVASGTEGSPVPFPIKAYTGLRVQSPVGVRVMPIPPFSDTFW